MLTNIVKDLTKKVEQVLRHRLDFALIAVALSYRWDDRQILANLAGWLAKDYTTKILIDVDVFYFCDDICRWYRTDSPDFIP